MDYIVVVPSIWPPFTEACLASFKGDHERVVVVDNTIDNKGVSGSWNVGRARALNEGADWLILLSAGIRFKEPGGLDFLTELERNAGAVAVEGDKGLGWHVIAFSRECLERVGPFDWAFAPAYMEDLDYSWRIRLAYRNGEGTDPLWPKVPVEAWVPMVAHGIQLAHVPIQFTALEELYVCKWGGRSGHERFERPYDDPEWNYTMVGPHPRAAEILKRVGGPFA